MDVQTLRYRLENQKGRRQQILNQISDATHRLAEQQRSRRRHEEAREVVRAVALATQKGLQVHVSDVTSLALEAVYDDPYQLAVEFVQRRNKTECDLAFERAGERIDPLSASGGGAVDVAAFALRVASWSMQRPRSRNMLVLDEPFSHLKGQAANLRVLKMVKEVSRRLGLQILMVSDERVDRDEVLENCDRCFEVKLRKGVSEVSAL